jgi:hypothetical protein
LPLITDPDWIAIPLNVRVNVADVDAVFATTIFDTTVLVEAGTVYRVELVVAAAALTSTLLDVAISYYLS